MSDEKKEVKQGNGIIEKKEEAITHKNQPYWKFTINKIIYSLFEYEAGKGLKVGDKVGMYWTETKKGDIIYRNLNSIFPEDENNPVVEEVVDDSNYPKNYKESKQKDTQKVQQFKEYEANKYELGMAKNNAAIIVAQKFGRKEDSKWDNGWEETYWELVKKLYNKGKEIRKELLGY